jgi:hypothetical protein
MSEVPTWRLSREDGTIAEAEKEIWWWEAFYEDGTHLKQFGDDGQYHQSGEIKGEGLLALWMVNGERPPICIHWRPGLKPLHKYANSIIKGEFEEDFVRLYCFGYEEFGIEYWTVIMPDGGIVITNNTNTIRVS